MRWIYLDANNSQEAAEYAAVVRRIDAWWEAFVAKSVAIGELFARRSDWDLPAWMDRHFHAISPSLMWEYGPAVKDRNWGQTPVDAFVLARLDAKDRKSTRLNSSHQHRSRMPSSA